MNWNILGRAPTLASVTPEDLLDGPVSAINGAVMHEPTPADYWVSCDAPHWMGETQPPNSPVVVTLARNAHHWVKRYEGLRMATYGDGKHLASCLPWQTRLAGRDGDCDWTHWSILLALYHAWQNGARRIRFGGVSMVGDTYAYSPKRIETKLGHDHRWRQERRAVAVAMSELTEHGGVAFDEAYRPRDYRCACGAVYRLGYVHGPMICGCMKRDLVA